MRETEESGKITGAKKGSRHKHVRGARAGVLAVSGKVGEEFRGNSEEFGGPIRMERPQGKKRDKRVSQVRLTPNRKKEM